MAKKTILIALPEEEHRDHLGKMATEMGLKAVYAKKSAEVVALMEAGVDCVLVDIRAAVMEPEVLRERFAEKPKLPVIACTDGGDKDDLLTALRAHFVDWLEHPIDANTLKEAFERAAIRSSNKLVELKSASEVSGSRALIKEIAVRIRDGNIDLPDVPEIVRELDLLLNDPNVDASKVVTLVERDPSIAARLVATVNTVTFGGNNWKGRITDIENAVNRLGTSTIHNLLRGEVMKDMFAFRSPAFRAIFEKMWRAHHRTACLSREIAGLAEIENVNEMYCLGLIHNIGELFLLRVFGEFFIRHSNQILSMDDVLQNVQDWHTTFGAALIKKWDLGDTFEQVAKNHHDTAFYKSEESDPEIVRKCYVVSLADQMSDYIGESYYPQYLGGPSIQECFTNLAIPDEKKDDVRKRAEEIYREQKDLLGSPS